MIYRLFDNDHSLLPAISSLDEVKGWVEEVEEVRGEGRKGVGRGPDANESVKTVEREKGGYN